MSRIASGIVLLLLVCFALLCSSLSAQSAVARVEESFRSEPNGAVLGVLRPGTSIPTLQRTDGWVEGSLEGWVWERSLQRSARGGFDLVVSAAGGENVRAAPSGAIIARLQEGTLLEEVERSRGWIRVRRRGWVWEASLSLPDAAAARGAGARPASSENPAPDEPAGGPSSMLALGVRGAAVLASPGGDTVGWASPNSDLQIVTREGSWLRVRMDGWVWAPASDSAVASQDEISVRPSQLVADPRFRGRVVRMELQFISLERAERIRTDFFEGEPFLLTRPLDGERFFIYVAIPPARLAEVEGLLPLERITVVGRVRTEAAAFTRSPIIDLIEIQWSRSSRRGP